MRFTQFLRISTNCRGLSMIFGTFLSLICAETTETDPGQSKYKQTLQKPQQSTAQSMNSISSSGAAQTITLSNGLTSVVTSTGMIVNR